MISRKEPYRNTNVAVSRSQEVVRKLLLENGAVGLQWTELTGEQIIELKWARGIIVDGVKKVQPLRIRISYKDKRVEQVYRALFWHLKAKFEIVSFGIVSFEEEFLPYFEMRLPNGKVVTVGEWCLPYLQKSLPPVLEPMLLTAGE